MAIELWRTVLHLDANTTASKLYRELFTPGGTAVFMTVLMVNVFDRRHCAISLLRLLAQER